MSTAYFTFVTCQIVKNPADNDYFHRKESRLIDKTDLASISRCIRCGISHRDLYTTTNVSYNG